jgi:hypothetical protein
LGLKDSLNMTEVVDLLGSFPPGDVVELPDSISITDVVTCDGSI